MSSIKIYGIPNCDSVKKALKWMEANGIECEFHDFKKEGVDQKKIENWCKVLGWETVLNKKSTSWRELSASQQKKITNEDAATRLMLEKFTLIKRPVVEKGKTILAGFNETLFNQHLK